MRSARGAAASARGNARRERARSERAEGARGGRARRARAERAHPRARARARRVLLDPWHGAPGGLGQDGVWLVQLHVIQK